MQPSRVGRRAFLTTSGGLIRATTGLVPASSQAGNTSSASPLNHALKGEMNCFGDNLSHTSLATAPTTYPWQMQRLRRWSHSMALANIVNSMITTAAGPRRVMRRHGRFY